LPKSLLKITEFLKQQNEFAAKQYALSILQYYKKAEELKSKGLDISDSIEPNLTSSIEERASLLLGLKDLEMKIAELKGRKNDKLQLALKMAEETVLGRFGFFKNEKLLELGIKVALVILTDAVTSIPVTNITRVELRRNRDGTLYPAVIFTDGIRKLPPWMIVLSLMILDHTRKLLGVDRYKIEAFGLNKLEETARFLQAYFLKKKRIYLTTKNLAYILGRIPIEVEQEEKTTITYVKRSLEEAYTKTNILAYVFTGILFYSDLLYRFARKLKLSDWFWLKKIVIKTNRNYSDVVILSLGTEKGGFRMRYERSGIIPPNIVAFHPMINHLLEGRLSYNSRVIINGEKRARGILFIENIEPPVVKLYSGDVLRLENNNVPMSEIKETLFLGDAVVFSKNNIKSRIYTEIEWFNDVKRSFNEIEVYNEEVNRIAKEIISKNKLIPSFQEAFLLSKYYKIPLHPRYQYFLQYLSISQIIKLRNAIKGYNLDSKKEIVFDNSAKETLEEALVPHKYEGKELIVDNDDALALFYILRPDRRLEKTTIFATVLDFLKFLSGLTFMNKVSTTSNVCIRFSSSYKEKRERPHVIFPLGGFYDIENDITRYDTVYAEVANLYCENCQSFSPSRSCIYCNSPTKLIYYCENCQSFSPNKICDQCGREGKTHHLRSIPIKRYLEREAKRLALQPLQPFKGVKSLRAETKIPEPIGKGIIRQYYAITIDDDSTVRYKSSDVCLVKVRPSDINVSIEDLRKLGYEEDIFGRPLVSNDQQIYLKPFDVIIPKDLAKELINVMKYMDELLLRYYGDRPFFKVETLNDLLGHLIVSTSSHTSLGTILRIIGFTNDGTCYVNPLVLKLKKAKSGAKSFYSLLLDVLVNSSLTLIPKEEYDGYPIFLQPVLHGNTHFKNVFYHNQFINFKKLITYKDEAKSIDSRINFQLQLIRKIRNLMQDDSIILIIMKNIYPSLIDLVKEVTSQKFICSNCGMVLRRAPLLKECPNCRKELKPQKPISSYKTVIHNLKPLLDKVTNTQVKEKINLLIECIESILYVKKQRSILDFI